MSWIQNILSVFTLLPANSGQAGVRELNKKFLPHGSLQPLVIRALVQIHHHPPEVLVAQKLPHRVRIPQLLQVLVGDQLLVLDVQLLGLDRLRRVVRFGGLARIWSFMKFKTGHRAVSCRTFWAFVFGCFVLANAAVSLDFHFIF